MREPLGLLSHQVGPGGLEFIAETFRLTPLSSQMLVVEREPLVLSGVSVRITAGREKLLADVLVGGTTMSRHHPEMWRKLDVTVSDLPAAGLAARDAGDLVAAITRTSHVALEVWSSSRTPEGSWPYAVVPWFNTEGVGAGVTTSRDWVEFSGDLFESWWDGGETWSDTLLGAISTEHFVPLVPVEEGALWSRGATTTAPPAATSPQEREALRAHDVQWRREKYSTSA